MLRVCHPLMPLLVLTVGIAGSAPNPIHAQSSTCHGNQVCGRYQMAWGGTRTDKANGMVPLPNGDLLLAGLTMSWGSRGDGLLLRVNGCGQVVWARAYGSAQRDELQELAVTPEGGIVAVGVSQGREGLGDVWVIKTDPNGVLEWSKVLGGAQQDHSQSIIVTSDGNIVIAGRTYSYGPNSPTMHNGWVAKLSMNGELLWSRIFSAALGSMDVLEIKEARNSAGDWDGLVFVGGSEATGVNNDEVWLGRMSLEGDHLWSVMYGERDDDEPFGFAQKPDGRFVITGRTDNYGATDRDVIVLEVGADGSFGWMRRYPGVGTDEGWAISVNGSGSVITGSTTSHGTGGQDAFILSLDDTGGVRSWELFGGVGQDDGRAVVATWEGGHVMAGATIPNGATAADVWLVRAGANGQCGCAQQPITLAGSSYPMTRMELVPDIVEAGEIHPLLVTQTDIQEGATVQPICECQEWIDLPGPSCSQPSDCTGTPPGCSDGAVGAWQCQQQQCVWHCQPITDPPDAGGIVDGGSEADAAVLPDAHADEDAGVGDGAVDVDANQTGRDAGVERPDASSTSGVVDAAGQPETPRPSAPGNEKETGWAPQGCTCDSAGDPTTAAFAVMLLGVFLGRRYLARKHSSGNA